MSVRTDAIWFARTFDLHVPELEACVEYFIATIIWLR